MQLRISGFNEELKNTVLRIKEKFGFLNDSVILEIENTRDNILSVSYDGKISKITSIDIPGVLRGIAILSDKLRKNAEFSLTEKRAFDKMGILIDLSRNAVLKNETMEDILDRIAVMGFNSALLYMEDTYLLDDYPYFGYMRGAYSKEDLKGFDKYALSLGIELMANIECLSHLESPLSWSVMSKIKESPRTLLADEPDTYKFVESMIKTIRECLSSNTIYLGMDEAHEVGRERHLDKFGYERPYDIFIRHLNKVCEITRKYNYNPVVCDDMFHRMFGNGGYYQVNAVFPDNISDTIPNDVTLLYWDYYNEREDFIERCINKSKEIKRPMCAMGGIWTWSGSINYDKTIKNARALLKALKKSNIRTLTACMWGDDGSEASIYSALLGMQLYAESFYGHNEDDLEHTKDMFRVCTGYNADTFMALDIDQIECDNSLRDCMPGYDIRANVIAKQATYQDILQGLFDYNLSKLDNIKEHFEKCAKKLEAAEPLGDLDYLREYVMFRAQTLAIKGDMGIRLKKAYDEKDRTALENIHKELKTLIDMMAKLHHKFGEIWLKNNKGFGLDRSDLRFGGVRARIERAYLRLSDYLDGKIDKIEELDIERLSYDGSEKALLHVMATSKIVSASQFR